MFERQNLISKIGFKMWRVFVTCQSCIFHHHNHYTLLVPKDITAKDQQSFMNRFKSDRAARQEVINRLDWCFYNKSMTLELVLRQMTQQYNFLVWYTGRRGGIFLIKPPCTCSLWKHFTDISKVNR